ncbi:class I SAM-dependent methyltransferase [Dongia deserti]|uniref:class I SAM-dependent methyltransferase n=1 Tax=Dongia deserti TaxID=2268030 RepID=UPI000E65937F|nr:class I SAM-dependent methyltransferase [Dongia deserti]
MRSVPARFRTLSDEQWTNLLVRSVHEPVIDGFEFPRFPADVVQSNFVGSSNETALREASKFYSFVKDNARSLESPISDDSVLLDFGCGWGRFLRFFWRDLPADQIIGVDVDPVILSECRKAGIQAHLQHIEPVGKLALADRSVSHIIAYSVFTHLPENVHQHWLDELARVAKPGCVFVCTTEPRRFLDFVAGILPDSPSRWHAALRRAAGNIEDKKRQFDAGQFVYIPTGGGDFRDKTVYGDAVIPPSYIERVWSSRFAVRSYHEEGFWQAAVVLQKE